MKLEPCPGCGRAVLIHSVANLTVKCEPTPLDGQGIAQELGAGRQIWTPEFGPGLIPKRLRPAQPGDSKLLREHRCVSVSGANPAPSVPAPPKAPQSPSGGRVAPSTRSSGPSTDHSGARRAASPRSETPVCSACSQPCQDGTYASIEVGELLVWAQHVEECRG